MRILFANDGFADAGGVHSYLVAVMGGLLERGHELGFLHCGTNSGAGLGPGLENVAYFAVCGTDGQSVLKQTLADVQAWGPEVVFSHNMSFLDVEQRFLDGWPVVKFMHGYFGTCIGGQKMHAWPERRPCTRSFGPACLAAYFPCRCGPLRLGKMMSNYAWARRQRGLFNRYAALVVASRHMQEEYVRAGISAEKVFVNPLFPADVAAKPQADSCRTKKANVLFLGRMTKLKGGDYLIQAASTAARRLGRAFHLIMAGDGPERPAWEQLASRLNVSAEFPGWVAGAERTRILSRAHLLAVPSLWPEPFGLVGLEAAHFSVPALAFDVGGIRAWLTDGHNGRLVPGNPPTVRALADGLVDVLRHPEQLTAMGSAARQTARRLSLSAHLDRLESTLTRAKPATEKED